MTHLESELQLLKAELLSMWQLVHSQLKLAQESLANADKDLAHEIILKEKRVNALETKLDIECENILALYSPVAIDLRLVLSILKINNNLERIADIAKSVAKLVIRSEKPIDPALVDVTEILLMFEEATCMTEDVMKGFESENTQLARVIFKRDELLDSYNKKSTAVIADYITRNPGNIEQALEVHTTIRKLERVGDHCTNIAEEIIFYIEAKFVKHSKAKKLAGNSKGQED
ncbi:MAG: phosphate signaling complex protein PhoU [Bacteroidetes bacterium]|nr:phosphate signaling complex protein PhoU [Bacteroidota bacterium]